MRLPKIALRNISRNIRRSILSAAAIGIAAWSIVMMFSFFEGMQRDLAKNQISYYTGEIRLRHSEFEQYERLNPLHLYVPDAEGAAEYLESVDGVEAVSPRVTFPTRILRKSDDGNGGEKTEYFNAMAWGVDFSREVNYQDLSLISGSESAVDELSNLDFFGVEGTYPEAGENQTLIGNGLAKKLGLEIGDKITIMSTTASRGTNAITLQITGFIKFPVGELNQMMIVAPIDRMQYFLRMPGGASEILIKTDGDTDNRELAAYLNEQLAEKGWDAVIAQAWEDVSLSYSMMEMADAFYDIFGIFFFILGSTVIINTTMMVIFERMREIGTMAALGLTGSELVRLFFLEAFYLSVIGSAVGVGMGILASWILGITGIPLGSSMEGIDFEISNVIYTALNLKSTVVVFIFSVIISSFATFLPSLRSARVQPVEALRQD